MRARSIPLYASLAALTIAAGLASRRYPEFFPVVVAQYAGDTLWATMAFWLLAMVWRRVDTRRLAAAAMTIAVAVECSQLYHAAWIDSIRKTALGALALGSGFLWSDLVCYAAGVCLAAAIDIGINRAGVRNGSTAVGLG